MAEHEPVTVRHLDDFESVGRGAFIRVRDGLGVSSFGINVERWPAGSDSFPEHDEGSSGQEEVYVPLSGSAVLIADGQEHELKPGTFARVAPGVSRKIVTREEGVELLCIGGVPGGAYKPAGPDAG
jgi:uncharacterized cupin superfamily protein